MLPSTRPLTAAALVLAVTTTLTASPGSPASAAGPTSAPGRTSAAGPAAPAVANPGFEADGGTAAPSGWTETGDAGAGFTEAGGHTGDHRLTHWSDADYAVTTSQRITGLRPGPYTLKAWVRSSGDQRAATVALRGCVLGEDAVEAPLTGDEWWVQVALPVVVAKRACTIAISSDAPAGAWLNVDDVELVPGFAGSAVPLAGVRINGADVSHLTKNEDHGAVYRDERGRPRDALQLLRSNGVNYARLKVWVDPADGYNAKADVLSKARRAKKLGMKLLIDFHYSDAWADPGKQNKPAAWADLPFDGLKQALHDHTYDVLAALRAQGTPADMAQLGNEINGGMLWPDGRWDNWDGLAALLIAGAEATKAASPTTKIVLHLAEGGNNGGHRWWFDNAVSRGVPFDVIAVSHYVYWHGPLGYLQANLFDLAERYDRPVMVVENAYGFTLDENDHETNIFNASLQAAGGYPATPAGQARALRDMFTVVSAVPNGRGLGVFYWEPTWTAADGAGWDPADPTSGDGWENQAVFDYSGRALPALRVLGRG